METKTMKEMISNGGCTLLVVTKEMLDEFARNIISEALAKARPKEEPVYSPKEFAARHKVDVSTLWRWVQNGTLKKTMVGRKVYYKDSDLQVKEG